MATTHRNPDTGRFMSRIQNAIMLAALAVRAEMQVHEGEEDGATLLLQAGHTYTQYRRELCPVCEAEHDRATENGDEPDPHPHGCTCLRDPLTDARGFESQGEVSGLTAHDLRTPDMVAQEAERESRGLHTLFNMGGFKRSNRVSNIGTAIATVAWLNTSNGRNAMLWLESGLSSLKLTEEAQEKHLDNLARMTLNAMDTVAMLQDEVATAGEYADCAEYALARAEGSVDFCIGLHDAQSSAYKLEYADRIRGYGLSRYHARHDNAIMANTLELLVGGDDGNVLDWLHSQDADRIEVRETAVRNGATAHSGDWRNKRELIRLGSGTNFVNAERDHGYSYESSRQDAEDWNLTDADKCGADAHGRNLGAARDRALVAADRRNKTFHRLATYLRKCRSMERKARVHGCRWNQETSKWTSNMDVPAHLFVVIKGVTYRNAGDVMNIWNKRAFELVNGAQMRVWETMGRWTPEKDASGKSIPNKGSWSGGSHGAGDAMSQWYLTSTQIKSLWALNDRRK